MKHMLNVKGFINPFFLNSVSREPKLGVVDNSMVIVGETLLRFDNDAGAPYPEGTKVIVSFAGNFYCESEAERDQRAKEKRERLAKNLTQQESRQRIYQAESDQANTNLKLPFIWQASSKVVLSGLTENSSGDGRNRATVIHIQTLEDILIGRLTRKAGQLLCSTKDAKLWLSNDIPTDLGSVSIKGMPMVTCKACLKRAKFLKVS